MKADTKSWPRNITVKYVTSHQQLRSYGNGATGYISFDRLVKLEIEPSTPGLQGEFTLHPHAIDAH